MMSTRANSLQKPERFDLYVRKFRATCVMHGVQTGSSADLLGFLQRLMADRHLSMDFWKLVGKLSNREDGELSDEQMLAVVVEGITGAEIPEQAGELTQPLNDLRALLAGVDVQGYGPSQVELAPFPHNDAGSNQSDGEWRTRAAESPQSIPDSQAGFTPEPVSGEADHLPQLPPTSPPQPNEAHARSELITLVEQYFGNIDEIESHVIGSHEKLAPMVDAPSATTHPSFDELAAEAPEDPNLKPIGSARLVLEPSAPTAEDPFVAKRGDSANRPPQEDRTQPEGYGRASLWLLLVLIVCGTVFAGYRFRAPLLRQISAGTHEKTGATNSSGSTAPEATPQAQPSHEPAQSSPQSASTPPSAVADAVKTRTPAASVGSQTAEGEVDASKSRKATTGSMAIQDEQTPANGISNADLSGAIRVAPAVMEANLFISRVPAYPENAKIAGVEGSVVMQAIISKDGTVKRVQVIQGDSRLRSAAAEAVYKWRYRPYLLNGRPVDVATTITVDFDLDR
jgi:TonB family protein